MRELKMEQERFERTKRLVSEAVDIQSDKVDKMVHDARFANRQMILETSNDFSDEDVRAEISQNLQMFAANQSGLNHSKENLRKLERLSKKPYFGRFDFQEDGYNKESCYIGIGNFMAKESFEILVYDWRAPICTLFYEGEYGPLTYEAPEGTIHGTVDLKRHFQVENKITAYYDMEEHPSDPVLLDVLSQRRGEKLYPIVQSIQRKQNEIIRMKDVDLLEVRGVPGSGKSIIALHRMAYLLYHGKNTYNHNNMVILSPNDFFKQYIDGVLPELGESSVQQFTFQELMAKDLPNSHFHYDQFMDMTIKGYKQSDFHNSMAHLGLLKSFFRHYVKHLHTYEDISFMGKVILTKAEIKNKLLANMDKPLQVTLDQLRDRVFSAIDYDKKVLKDRLRPIVKKHKNYALNPMKGVHRLMDKRMSLLYTTLDRVLTLDVHRIFKVFRQGQNKFAYPRAFKNMRRQDDVYAKMLIQSWIQDHHRYKNVRYVLIDECQDYNAIQYALIQYWFKNAHVTLLGDLNQTINKKPDKDFSHMVATIFQPKRQAKVELMTCYRSTEHIVNLANRFMATDMVAIGRKGERPLEVSVKRKDLAQVIRKHTKVQTAVITATMSQAKKLQKQLGHDFKLLHEDGVDMIGNHLIMPIFYAKGLEFDHVIYVREKIDPGLQPQVDYTAITRAKHELTLIQVTDMC